MLWIHGGAWIGGDMRQMDILCKLFSQQGYISATIGYTLLIDEFKVFNIYRIMDEITAAIKAIKQELINQGFNSDKLILGIGGYSAGGHLALLYSYLVNNINIIPIKFVVDFVGPVGLHEKYFYKLKNGSKPLVHIDDVNEIEQMEKNGTLIKVDNTTKLLEYMNAFSGNNYTQDLNSMLDDKGEINTTNKKFLEMYNYIKYAYITEIEDKHKIPTIAIYGGTDNVIGVSAYAYLKEKAARDGRHLDFIYSKYEGHMLIMPETEDGKQVMWDTSALIMKYFKQFFSENEPSIDIFTYFGEKYLNLDYSVNDKIENSFKKDGGENYIKDVDDLNDGQDYPKNEKNIYDLYIPKYVLERKNEINGIILWIHGGGWREGDKSEMELFCNLFSQQGYISANMEYTLLNGQYNNSNIYRILDEITACIKAIKEKLINLGFNGNKLRLVIGGYSAGAHLSLLYSYLIKNVNIISLQFIIDFVGPVGLYPEYYYMLKNTSEPLDDISNLTIIKQAQKEEKLVETFFVPYIHLVMNGFYGNKYTEEELQDMHDENGNINTSNSKYIAMDKVIKNSYITQIEDKHKIPTICVYGGIDDTVGITNFAYLKEKANNDGRNLSFIYSRYEGHNLKIPRTEDGKNAIRDASTLIMNYLKKYLDSDNEVNPNEVYGNIICNYDIRQGKVQLISDEFEKTFDIVMYVGNDKKEYSKEYDFQIEESKIVRFEIHSNKISLKNMFKGINNIKSIFIVATNKESKIISIESAFQDSKDLEEFEYKGWDNSELVSIKYAFSGCERLTDFSNINIDLTGVKDLSYLFANSNIETFAPIKFDLSLVESMAYMFYDCAKLKEVKFPEVNSLNLKDMSHMFENCDSLISVDLSNLQTSKVRNMLSLFRNCISLQQLNISSFDTSEVIDMSHMFENVISLSSLDLSLFDTSKVINMTSMFSGCNSLDNITLKNFDTSQVEDMSYMFSNCKKISLSPVVHFQTPKVKNFEGMFEYCSELGSLNLTHFITSNAENMKGMFKGCNKLNILNLWNSDTSKVQDMSSMFEGCKNLGSLEVYRFITANLRNMSHMFDECMSLTSLTITHFNTEKVEDMSYLFSSTNISNLNLQWNTLSVKSMKNMFRNMTNLVTLIFSNNFKTDNVETMEGMFNQCHNLESIDISGFNVGKVESFDYFVSDCYSLKALDVSYFKTKSAKSMRHMFSSCYYLDIIDIRNFDTSLVTDMNYMFNECKSIASLDISYFDTSNVKDMKGMFRMCQNLSFLDVSYFKTRNVEDMATMFYGLEKLERLDVGKFETNKVTDFHSMFGGCKNLKNLDVRSFQTDASTDLSEMFSYCESLTYLDLSGFNTNNVNDMNSMLVGCFMLETINGLEKLSTEKVNDLSYMFKDCKKLSIVNLGDKFTGKVVENINEMFSGCESLISLDLSHFNIRYVEQMDSLFYNCKELISIKINNKYFITSNVRTMNDMFWGCQKLISFDFSGFDTSRVESMDRMFFSCISLQSLDLSSFLQHN